MSPARSHARGHGIELACEALAPGELADALSLLAPTVVGENL